MAGAGTLVECDRKKTFLELFFLEHSLSHLRFD